VSNPQQTPLHANHVALGAKMVEFAGWEMPILYASGIVAEHLATRRAAGLFDVSHMGRFEIRGPAALAFLQRVLTNNVAALLPGEAHYTLIPTETGGALDDAYLYRLGEEEYLLVVNAGNRERDWAHLRAQAGTHSTATVDMRDLTSDWSMLAVQGPRSEGCLAGLVDSGRLPEPKRNKLAFVTMFGVRVLVARTGYTGEPICFELFMQAEAAPTAWEKLREEGAVPVGLGARDTLRLEAGLPLYGHELGCDPEGLEIPIMSCPLAVPGVSLLQAKGDFIGRASLSRQADAYRRIRSGDLAQVGPLLRMVRPVAVTGRGIARAGASAVKDGKRVGWVTSGTMVPYWPAMEQGTVVEEAAHFSESEEASAHELRSICLALLDSAIMPGDLLALDVRGKEVEAVVVRHHLRSDLPPFARPVVYRAPAS